LAILTQESNLGANVGQCYLKNPDTGAGVGKNTGTPFWNVMKPTRDVEPFLEITNKLGFNAFQTAVSCPIAGVVGWGGAMGPAQFIPSTWMGYKDKVAALTGKSPANPWDIRDAFVAASVLLKANGANATYQGEWNAAMRYFSGSTNLKYRFYGDSVMELTKKYDSDLETLR